MFHLDSTTLEAARAYLDRGWCSIPIPLGEKRPKLPGWQRLRLTEDDLPQHFDGRPQNIGVLLGEPSGGLVDVDLDCPKAMALAGNFLPATGAVFGRKSKPRSHWLYQCPELAQSCPFKMPDGTVLVEVRSTGAQTVFPPSTHPSGERVEWASDGEPAQVGADELLRAVRRLAAAALLARLWPERGSRHDAALALAGALARAGWDQDEAARFVGAVARVAGDEEWQSDRVRAAMSTAETLAEGGAVTGLPTLASIVGREVVDRVAEWLDLRRPTDGQATGDYQHAAVLASLFKGRLRWATHREAWMRWTGQVWRPVIPQAVVTEASEALQAEYARRLAGATSKHERVELARLVQEACSYHRVSRALEFLKGWAGVMTEAGEWDRDPWLLNVLNGTIDLRARELRPHDPNNLITMLAPVEYQPGTQGTFWREHLEMFLPDDNVRRQVQRDLGVALVGTVVDEALPIWYGQGGNGKTVTYRALLQVLGDYADKAAQDLLVQRRTERHPTELADLMGKRLVFAAETEEGQRLAESLVKNLTGGDRLKARFMRQDFFSFEASASIVLVTNHKPAIRGTDYGIWRRVRLVPWNQRVPDDRRLDQDTAVARLVAEGPAVLNWLIEGLEDWQRNKWWTASEVQAATQAYREEMDTVGDFIEQCCELRAGARVKKAELRQAYIRWAYEVGERELPAREFTRRLRDMGIGEDRSNGVRYYTGIRLRPGGDAAEAPIAGNEYQALALALEREQGG